MAVLTVRLTVVQTVHLRAGPKAFHWVGPKVARTVALKADPWDLLAD